MSGTPTRYRSSDEDSARWQGLALRPGDIVISTRSKSGTTWMQMICALLVLRTPELPAPLSELSPWLDWLVEPQEAVYARLAAQRHRRFIKTHTPLDGVPADPQVHYVVVARHPLDLAVSLHHQAANLDRARLAELTGQPDAPEPERPRPPIEQALVRWIDADPDPRTELDSLPGVLWHLRDAWVRRHRPNIHLVHYDDLRADLSGQMHRLAARLGLDPPGPELVEAATFDRMRAHADRLAPDPAGVLKDRQAFFRSGRSGQGRAMLDDEARARYRSRCAALAPPDLLSWLHRDG
ncbi:Sulfotransferase domain-containing protein [Micromonospora phaseoli]|uniref:Sulfotransferase domain-containing protein n=1 Tax=Micromonospora phaseoli TaxID=1144548 RepID=A0A1H7CUX4_9ACTN|nr:sulfotransferase domain-containing protein [Micromonospora phaseoli]PZV91563.1 sulfotransferase domain-containing protein [Micromonospora phaseoli]GIJ80777.1 glycolipid sulfotransferase [Micromonospora phaseoli]SEJ92377.1 Sulfotransferase domain-containing protein [Micromonospora phaseoli]